MNRKILVKGLALLVALPLAIGAFSHHAEAAPATHDQPTSIEHAAAVEAPVRMLHNFDATSLWVCAATRPDGSWTVYGSHPLWVVPDQAGYRCWAYQASTGRHWCWHAQITFSTGYMYRTAGPWDFSLCGPS